MKHFWLRKIWLLAVFVSRWKKTKLNETMFLYYIIILDRIEVWIIFYWKNLDITNNNIVTKKFKKMLILNCEWMLARYVPAKKNEQKVEKYFKLTRIFSETRLIAAISGDKWQFLSINWLNERQREFKLS